MVHFMCSRCGYVGDVPLHEGCDYAAVPLDLSQMLTRCESAACIIFEAMYANRGAILGQMWTAAVAAADDIQALEDGSE